MFTYHSYSRGYQAYKDVWRPIASDELFICKREETNECDKNGVSIMFDDCISKNVVGHVPFNWSKLAAKFLQFPNHRIRVIVTGKQVNRSAGFGLKIPVDYCIFYEFFTEGNNLA